jgi:hypothetical protein
MGWLFPEKRKKREFPGGGPAGAKIRKFVTVAMAEISRQPRKLPKFGWKTIGSANVG